MTHRGFLLYGAALTIAVLPGLVRADIDSAAGLATCFLTSAGACNYTSGSQSTETTGPANVSTNLAGTTVAITNVDSAWQPNNPVNPGDSTDSTAVWIGAVNSGDGATDPFVSPSNGTTGYPVYQITDTFAATAGQSLDLDVWADDSVNIWLNGVELVVGTPITGASACSGVVVGCTPGFPPSGDGGAFVFSGLAASNTLVFDVYQTGTTLNSTGNPTGLLFTGAAVNTPEPGAAALLISMLAAIAGVAGIFRKKLA